MQRRANLLLIWHIISTILEEAVLVVVVIWGLPKLGVRVPPWVLAPVMPAVAAYSVFTYRKSIQALRTKPVAGLTSMVGSRGEVVRRLAPEGVIKIGGELWTATAVEGSVTEGRTVVVIDQERLKLVVRDADSSEAPG